MQTNTSTAGRRSLCWVVYLPKVAKDRRRKMTGIASANECFLIGKFDEKDKVEVIAYRTVE